MPLNTDLQTGHPPLHLNSCIAVLEKKNIFSTILDNRYVFRILSDRIHGAERIKRFVSFPGLWPYKDARMESLFQRRDGPQSEDMQSYSRVHVQLGRKDRRQLAGMLKTERESTRALRRRLRPMQA